jgi:hypothetical protein
VRKRIQGSALEPADKARIDICVDQLQAAAKALGDGWVVKLFGSVANGFGTRASDIDAAFVREAADGEPPEEPLFAANLMKDRLIPLLQDKPKFEIVEEILGAKVPIVKLRFDSALDVDLSCQNSLPIQNTQLLKAYSSLDARVRDLGIAVKLWAKAAGVCGACKGHLSSYTFTLLTIYFMQVHPDVKLPCLPPAAFAEGGESGQAKLAAARSVFSNRQSLGELLFRFFMFYTHDFVWGHEVISVRLGHRLHTHEQFFEELRGRWQVRLHVEDPYQLERNLHCVLGEVEEGQLREAFSNASYYIQCGRSPVGLGPDNEDPSTVMCEFEGFATSPPATPQVSPNSTPSSPAQEMKALLELQDQEMGELKLSDDMKLGSFRSGGSSASTRGSMSDGAFAESSGDEPAEQAERLRAEEGLQWWKMMGVANVNVGEPTERSRNVQPDGRESGDQKVVSNWVTLEDLEGILAAAPMEARPGTRDIPLLIGTSYSAKATRSIARRIAKACERHVSWQ